MFVNDFTPVEYQAYFDELLSSVSYKGMVIDSQFSPVVGWLKGGRYDATRRDLKSERRAIYEYLKSKFE